MARSPVMNLMIAAAFASACAQDGVSPPPSPRVPLLSQLAAEARSAPVDPGAQPPVARREPRVTTLLGRTRVDDYFWLRQKDTPEVVAYLNAENAYTDRATRPMQPLADALYGEMLSRIEETDATAPTRDGDWLYYSRTEKGKEHPIYCRKRADPARGSEGPEVVLVDPNEIGKTEPFVDVEENEVSDDGNLYAYGLDTTGFRQFTLHVKDLRTSAELPERIPRVDSVAFTRDPRTIFYVTEDAQTKRANQVHRHVLGDDPSKDPLVYEEKDERFDVWLHRSRSRDFVVVTSASMTATEVRLLDASHPTREPRVVEPRSADHEY